MYIIVRTSKVIKDAWAKHRTVPSVVQTGQWDSHVCTTCGPELLGSKTYKLWPSCECVKVRTWSSPHLSGHCTVTPPKDDGRENNEHYHGETWQTWPQSATHINNYNDRSCWQCLPLIMCDENNIWSWQSALEMSTASILGEKQTNPKRRASYNIPEWFSSNHQGHWKPRKV